MRCWAVLATGLLLASCGGRDVVAPGNAPLAGAVADWRKVVTPADHDRLMGWRSTWNTALAAVRRAGEGARLDDDPALFDPDRTLATARPPAGAYRCRWYKLGGTGTAMRGFTAYPPFDCTITDEGDIASFAKTGGSQRPVGLIFHDNGRRAVFLGTLMLGDETAPIDYGRDRSRDMAGYVERIGERRWRLVLPRPRFESMLDVIEIVPA